MNVLRRKTRKLEHDVNNGSDVVYCIVLGYPRDEFLAQLRFVGVLPGISVERAHRVSGWVEVNNISFSSERKGELSSSLSSSASSSSLPLSRCIVSCRWEEEGSPMRGECSRSDRSEPEQLAMTLRAVDTRGRVASMFVCH
eukprot:TRINITY_DN722_c0_g1_i1.p1 TRINITY_DN722_c0_g1~~TRINITY_DN722_c0_g1_i1.p1  ORF type:complete len:141 (+),score=10.28 TRINITY_DN722_c0_g1_i1:221-643(+)